MLLCIWSRSLPVPKTRTLFGTNTISVSKSKFFRWKKAEKDIPQNRFFGAARLLFLPFFCMFFTFEYWAMTMSSSSRWYAHIFLRSFLALVLPMILVKIERNDIKQTGHNLSHSTQVRLNQSSLVATFPSATYLLCLICTVFSSAAPAALHFPTIFQSGA